MSNRGRDVRQRGGELPTLLNERDPMGIGAACPACGVPAFPRKNETTRLRSRTSGRINVPEGNVDWRDHVVVDPSVCRGQATVKGTRIPVSVVLDNLATGLTPNEITAAYPSVSAVAVQAAVAYAAELARERVLAMP